MKREDDIYDTLCDEFGKLWYGDTRPTIEVGPGALEEIKRYSAMPNRLRLLEAMDEQPKFNPELGPLEVRITAPKKNMTNTVSLAT